MHRGGHPGAARNGAAGALTGCPMAGVLFGYRHEEFVPQVKEYVGAATFLPMARDADVSLFI